MAIEGERVRLRALEPDDLERFLVWLNDPDVTRTTSARYPVGREAQRAALEQMGRAASYEGVAFAIEVRESAEHIGTLALQHVRPENRGATLVITIGAKSAWGHGYGYDAMRTLLRFGFWEMNLRFIELDVIEDNPRAIALYKRLGFAHHGTARGAFFRRGRAKDALLMSITREEFDALHGPPPDLREEPLP